ncbi:magnesium-translocating P-type ATPase [Streptomyces sp. NPDC059176]|uniref:magnesium-translocating P-type ATPase n=1 Tax=unclassified Streptomyces TaxID=2593676 RepID=UPI0036C36B3F
MLRTDTAAGKGAGAPVHAAGGAACDGATGLDAATVLQVLRQLDCGPRGLTEAQAVRRLERFGDNALPARRSPTWPRLVVRGLRDPFTAVLLGLGVVAAAVQAWGTACVILFLVVVSCVLRAAGEHRADRSTAALRRLVSTTSTVVRRAGEDAPPTAREVPVDELVPGDIVRFGPGDVVPADVRLLRASGLSVHQSTLTGESTPVAKYAVDVPASGDGGVLAQPQLCFQGSSVASGTGTAVVVGTGARTRLAATGGASAWQRESSAFDRSVHGISWILIRFMLLAPPLVLMANAALRGRGLETLPFAVAVAVGLTPEMLPVIVTTCLARGAAHLARAHGVIVKRLPALHDLGAVEVLCLDKTGTLTQDRPIVERALDAEGREDLDVLRWATVNAWWTLQLAEVPEPDALDAAVLDAAVEDDVLAYDGVASVPFDPQRRLSTAVVRTPGRLGTHTLVVKGAVEEVLARCTPEQDGHRRLSTLAAAAAEEGLRVLAVATSERRARTGPYTPSDERGLTLRGLVTFRDALAPTAAGALGVLAEHGVSVKILTGDHPGTAARVCRDLDLPSGPDHVLTADRIDRLGDADLAGLVRRTTVFARCTPDHKARITAALRSTGRTVGFLGDGVNDLPALRAADVGIAPRGATDVARESADVILAEKDLTAIGHAVRSGRFSGGNIATYLRVTLSSNLGNVIAMLSAGLLLPFLPMLPTQVLVQNLCFDTAQLAFAYDRPDPSVLRRPIRLDPGALLRFLTGFGALNALADLATFGALALSLRSAGTGDDEALFHSGWFTENLLTQALVMVILRTGHRRVARGALGPVQWAAAALAVVGLVLPPSPLGPVLGLSALPPSYYLLLGCVLAVYAAALLAARARDERRRAEAVRRSGAPPPAM